MIVKILFRSALTMINFFNQLSYKSLVALVGLCYVQKAWVCVCVFIPSLNIEFRYSLKINISKVSYLLRINAFLYLVSILVIFFLVIVTV